MEDIVKLNFYDRISEEDKLSSSDFVNVNAYKFLRISCFSNCMVQLQMCWSLNGVTTAITEVNKIAPNVWRSFKFDCLMAFVKIIVVVEHNEISETLTVNVSGRRFSENQHQVKYQEPLVDTVEKRSSSPMGFRKKIFQSAKRKSTQHDEVKFEDHRLPHLFLDNQLFVGNRGNKVRLLPIGNPGQVLSVNDANELEWMDK